MDTKISLAILIAAIGFTVWCVRLEAHVGQQDKDQLRIERRVSVVSRMERRLLKIEMKLGIDQPEKIPIENDDSK